MSGRWVAIHLGSWGVSCDSLWPVFWRSELRFTWDPGGVSCDLLWPRDLEDELRFVLKTGKWVAIHYGQLGKRESRSTRLLGVSCDSHGQFIWIVGCDSPWNTTGEQVAICFGQLVWKSEFLDSLKNRWEKWVAIHFKYLVNGISGWVAIHCRVSENDIQVVCTLLIKINCQRSWLLY